MARKPRKQKQKQKASYGKSVSQERADGPTASAGTDELRTVFRQLLRNRPGTVGFLLSLLQIPVHSAWILLTWYLNETGRAKALTPDSALAWLMSALLGLGMILTVVSLFVCLFFGLRQAPRTLAVIGLALSFFIGALASALVFMMAIRAMAGP